MIEFPIFESIAVDGYALYMRDQSTSGFEKKLGAGTWLILGVNGLGKSTLLLILRALLLGKTRVAMAGFQGQRNSDLLSSEADQFAVRVLDKAKNATATAKIRFGTTSITIRRSLRDLSFISCTLHDYTESDSPPDLRTSNEGEVRETVQTEDQFRDLISRLMGIEDFANVVRVIDRCVLCLENRKTLLWDVASQYELFRATLVPAETAQKLRFYEGQIVSADSSARNLNAALFSIAKRRAKNLSRQSSAPNVTVRIEATNADLERKRQEFQDTQATIDKLTESRADLATQVMRSERLVEEHASSYEDYKLTSLRDLIANLTNNEQYTLLKLISDRVCPACGSSADEAASEIEARQNAGECVICGSHLPVPHNHGPTAMDFQHSMQSSYMQLIDERHKLLLHREGLDEKLLELRNAQMMRKTLSDAIEEASKRLRALRAQLPVDEQADLERSSQQTEHLRNEVLSFRQQREEAEVVLRATLTELKEAVQMVKERLEERFNLYASKFFGDRVRLVYAPRLQRVGQYGQQLEFPAFEVEMIGATTSGQFARRNEDQVSLSQNYYLDLAFRMAVIDVIGTSGGSLVVDGPETSLDAVFAALAGELLSSFSTANLRQSNQIISASNIIDGAFLPKLLGRYTTPEARQHQMLNLMDIAAPTPTLEAKRDEYSEAVRRLVIGAA